MFYLWEQIGTMAGNEFHFRPKDADILIFMRQKANEENRSVNNWLEVLLKKMMESEKYYKEDKPDE